MSPSLTEQPEFKQDLDVASGLTARPQTEAGVAATPSGADSLLLKWGTLKGWNLQSEAARAAARKYGSIGNHAPGAMQQHDTNEQREALCELIDAIDGQIQNDWSGEIMTKDEAKAYVRGYGQ